MRLNYFKSILNRKTFIFTLIFVLGVTIGYIYSNKSQIQGQSVIVKPDPYQAFLSEVYDKTKENYWDNLTDEQLITLFKLATEKLGGGTLDIKTNNKDEFLKAFDKYIKNIPQEKRRGLTVTITGAVLANLNPAGRSGLYTEKLETELKNTVQNINPDKDLYKDLGLNKGASKEEVEEASKKLTSELQKQAETSPEAKKKLEQVTYAKEVLAEPEKKERYDVSGVEPTVFSKLVTGDIAYIYLKKFSPTTFDEFQKAFTLYEKDNGPRSLIFDLRSNVGGAIDVLPFFLGNFIGKNQYAFDFYQKGDYKPFKTVLDKLPSISKYRQVIVLIDNKTQSSAELMASVLKKYNVGIVVGVPSKGWGTVERVFPIDNQIDESEKYSIFLVHSVTIREDGQPIEGRGVEPTINTNEGEWPLKLTSYFNNPSLTQAVQNILSQKLAE